MGTNETAAGEIERLVVRPEGLSQDVADRFAYSYGVSVGRLLFISGQVALDHGQIVGGYDITAQAEQVFQNLRRVTTAAGGSLDDLVSTTTYMTDRQYSLPINEVRNRYLTGPIKPTSTLIVVAGLARPEFLVEIEAIALLPAGAND